MIYGIFGAIIMGCLSTWYEKEQKRRTMELERAILDKEDTHHFMSFLPAASTVLGRIAVGLSICMAIFFSLGIEEKGKDMIPYFVIVAVTLLIGILFQVSGARWKMIVEEDDVTVYPALFGKVKKFKISDIKYVKVGETKKELSLYNAQNKKFYTVDPATTKAPLFKARLIEEGLLQLNELTSN